MNSKSHQVNPLLQPHISSVTCACQMVGLHITYFHYARTVSAFRSKSRQFFGVHCVAYTVYTKTLHCKCIDILCNSLESSSFSSLNVLWLVVVWCPSSLHCSIRMEGLACYFPWHPIKENTSHCNFFYKISISFNFHVYSLDPLPY